MQLKPYQADTLAVLRRFLEEARIAGPRNAYEAITREPEQAGRLGGYAGAYGLLNQMPDVPYVCLRLPTGGGVRFSFANVLHHHRPLMIVDEAHNAVTGLTRDMQARVNPCAIVEFTATPRRKSNILHSVSAQELKRADRIKLPVMLAEHDTWQSAVNGAIAARASLAETAQHDPAHIRPIVLFQAQPKNQEVTVGALKKHLVIEYKGSHLGEGSDTDEKRTIGALWQRKSDGQGLFIVAEKDDNGKDARQQVEAFLRADGRSLC